MSFSQGVPQSKDGLTQELRSGELRISLPCSLEAVENFCQDFRAWHTQVCQSRDTFACELLLREALVNGAEHGTGETEHSALQTNPPVILCVLRGNARRLLIAVRDPGAGFNWRAAARSPKSSCEPGGRGVAIFYRYAQRVRFLEAGNGVTLIRRFSSDPKE